MDNDQIVELAERYRVAVETQRAAADALALAMMNLGRAQEANLDASEASHQARNDLLAAIRGETTLPIGAAS